MTVISNLKEENGYFGIVKVWPRRITVPRMLFALWILETLAPYLRARPERVSPFLTVCRTVTGLGLGLGFGVTFTTGFRVGLVAEG